MTERVFEEQEIDLLDILWRLIEQWKCLLVAGLIMGIVIGGYAGLKPPAPTIENVEEVVDSTVSAEPEIINKDAEFQTASTALAQYFDYILVRDSYEKNVFNLVDFDSATRVTCIYEMEASDSSQLQTLGNVYNYISDSEKFTDDIASVFPEEVDPSSIYELIGINVSTNSGNPSGRCGTITIAITLPGDIEVETWDDAVDKGVKAYQSSIEGKVGSHTLRRVAVSKKEVSTSSLLKTKNAKITEVSSCKNTFESTRQGLHASAKEILDEIIEDSKDSHDISLYRTELENRKDEFMDAIEKEQEEINASAQEVEAIAEPIVTEVPVHRSGSYVLKRFILGFVLGVMLYCMGYAAIYVLVRVVRCENDLESLAGIRNFGGIYKYHYQEKKDIFIHDKRVYDFRIRKGKTSEQIVKDLISKLEFNHEENVTFFSLGTMKSSETELVKSQMAAVENQGISVKQISIMNADGEMSDDSFVDVKNAFICLLGNRTKMSDMGKLYSKLKEYNVSIIGSEYIEM